MLVARKLISVVWIYRFNEQQGHNPYFMAISYYTEIVYQLRTDFFFVMVVDFYLLISISGESPIFLMSGFNDSVAIYLC